MSDIQFVTITKQHAAECELTTAIRLFFEDAAPISVNVLASAAATLARDMCRAQGLTSFRDNLLERVYEHKHKEFIRELNAAYNFFKHADKDHGETFPKFNESSNDYLLLEACIDHWTAFRSDPPAVQIFRGWFVGVHPYLFRLEGTRFEQVAESASRAVGGLSRKRQKEAGREMLEMMLRQSPQKSA